MGHPMRDAEHTSISLNCKPNGERGPPTLPNSTAACDLPATAAIALTVRQHENCDAGIAAKFQRHR